MHAGRMLTIRLADIRPVLIRAGLNRLNPGFATEVRTIQHYQFQYIYHGVGVIEVAGQAFAVSKGDLCAWGPGVKHRIASSKREPLTILGAQFHMVHEQAEVAFTDFPGIPPFLKLHNPGQVELLFLSIVQEFSAQKIYFAETVNALIHALILLIARQVSTSGSKGGEHWKLIDHILPYIHENYDKALTNRDIAEYFNFHPAHINKLVRTWTGLSLHQYLLNVKMNKAMEMLSSTDMTVGEIAASLGYANIHYFSTLFKRKMGFPPTWFRDPSRHMG